MKKVYLKTLTVDCIIKRLNRGDVVKGEDGSKFYMEGGFIIFEHKDGVIMNSGIPNGGTYFEEEGTDFEVKKTGLYKTRDGSKAFVSFLYKDGCSGVIEHEDIKSKWHIDGSYIDKKQPDNDLVEYVGD